MKLPLVSVVITNRNGRLYLRRCLRSVMTLTYPHFEVVLVDNASTDGSVSMVSSEFPRVKMVVTQRNLGYAAGNNLGVRFASGDYIFFLNNDTIVNPSALTELVDVAQQDLRIGILGCKIYFPYGITVQHAGGLLRASGDTEMIGYGQKDMGQFESIRDVDWVSGAAIMVKQDALEMTEGFETLFGLYKEDVDLCFRARKANFRVVYVPRAIVYHHMSATIDRVFDDRGKYYLLQRSRVAFITKNFGGTIWLKWAAWELRNLVFHIVAAIYRWDTSNLSALVRAYRWNLVNLPTILQLRFRELPRERNQL